MTRPRNCVATIEGLSEVCSKKNLKKETVGLLK